jgi:RNA polymerase sigma-70 factor (ECF subfamily)
MSDPPAPLPPHEEALRLHQRLVEDADRLARHDLAEAYLEPLAVWLRQTNRGLDPDLCEQAAEDAVLALIHRPKSYDPGRGTSLEAYLRMSARGDLRNLSQKERRRHAKQVSLARVELLPDAGKYLGQDDDPSLRLRIAEEPQDVLASVPESVLAGLNEGELRFLRLMLEGERDSDVFAEAYGMTDRPPAERRQEVKRVKDRLKKRLERAGWSDE